MQISGTKNFYNYHHSVRFSIMIDAEVNIMEFRKNMSTILRSIMQERGQSIIELSNTIKISRNTLEAYLSGNSNPTISTIESIARELNIDAMFLITGHPSSDTAYVVIKLLDDSGVLFGLPENKRMEFAKLLLSMISLWDDERHKC